MISGVIPSFKSSFGSCECAGHDHDTGDTRKDAASDHDQSVAQVMRDHLGVLFDAEHLAEDWAGDSVDDALI